MSIEAMAVEFVAATKKRAQARSHLSALRKKYLEETGEFFDKDEGRGEEGYDEMMAALKAREDANADYRRAKSRLFRVCAAGVMVDAPTLPQSLLDLIGEYGMARTDGVSDVERLHRWQLLIDGIKDYARGVPGTHNTEEKL
jgi:hypothetical protein